MTDQTAASPATLSRDQLEHWLSAPRASRYLRAAAGDVDVAVALYDWNSRVAAAAFTDAGHVEVALRNAYDRQFSAARPDWSIEPGLPILTAVAGHPNSRQRQQELNDDSRALVAKAVRSLGSNPSHGRVVAALMFGFWAMLTDPKREATYWTHALRSAFPNGTSRGQVHDLVTRVNRFRNRLAHNEPVFSQTTGLGARMRDVGDLLARVDPDAATWVAAHSTVESVVDTCPVPGLVIL